MRLRSRITGLDQRLSARLAVWAEKKGPRILAQIVAHSGDSPLWMGLAFAALAWGAPPAQAVGWRVLTATLSAGAATTVLKWIFRRQRPPGPSLGFYTRLDRHAFPSGHAGRTACIAVMLAPMLPPAASLGLAAWTVGVGVSRVMLQVHFLSDILAGWLTGFLIGKGLLSIL